MHKIIQKAPDNGLIKTGLVDHEGKIRVENNIAVNLIIFEQGLGFGLGGVSHHKQITGALQGGAESRIGIQFSILNDSYRDFNKFLGAGNVGKGQVKQGGQQNRKQQRPEHQLPVPQDALEAIAIIK